MHKIAWIDRALWVFLWIEALGDYGSRVTQQLMLLQFVLGDKKTRFFGSPEHPTESNVRQTRTLPTPNIGMDPTEPYFLQSISKCSTLPRQHSGQAKVPSPLIERHRVVTLFDVVRQREIPRNI